MPDPKEGFQILDYIPSFSDDDSTESEGEQLPNLADATSGGFLGLQDWGYSVGQLAGRAPIVLPAKDRFPWEQSALAQRAREHSAFILSFFIMSGFCIVGIRRVPDFWMQTPEERAYYWPGRQSKQDEGQDPEGVDLEKSGAGVEK